MARELAEQTNLIKSVRLAGGYARKMSNRYSIGIPDLLIGLPPFVPFLAEMKDLGTVVDDFDRQLNVTPKQNHEMGLLSGPYERAAYGAAALVLVHIVHRREHRLVALSRSHSRLAAGYEADLLKWGKRRTGLIYAPEDLRKMFRHAMIAEARG